jgi:hypothetical protein
MAASAPEHPRQFPPLFLVLCAALLFLILPLTTLLMARPTTQTICPRNHARPTVVNVTYHPSTFEAEWARLKGPSDGSACLRMAEPEHKGRVEAVLHALDAQHEAAFGRLPAASAQAALDAAEAEAGEGALLSVMEYALSDGTTLRVRMEPLAGLLRDPRQSCPPERRGFWAPHVADMVKGDMRHWLLLDERRGKLHAGQRAVLLDMGASTWAHAYSPQGAGRTVEGASWLNERLRQHGMAFEHIWSFEAGERSVASFLNGAEFADMARLHYFNLPVGPKGSGGSVDPWALLKSTVAPDDFVAVKLDIDTPSAEIPLAYQLLEDPELLALVDEFYFEYHYVHEDVLWLFGGKFIPETLERATHLFAKLREMGVRAYSWY